MCTVEQARDTLNKRFESYENTSLLQLAASLSNQFCIPEQGCNKKNIHKLLSAACPLLGMFGSLDTAANWKMCFVSQAKKRGKHQNPDLAVARAERALCALSLLFAAYANRGTEQRSWVTTVRILCGNDHKGATALQLQDMARRLFTLRETYIDSRRKAGINSSGTQLFLMGLTMRSMWEGVRQMWHSSQGTHGGYKALRKAFLELMLKFYKTNSKKWPVTNGVQSSIPDCDIEDLIVSTMQEISIEDILSGKVTTSALQRDLDQEKSRDQDTENHSRIIDAVVTAVQHVWVLTDPDVNKPFLFQNSSEILMRVVIRTSSSLAENWASAKTALINIYGDLVYGIPGCVAPLFALFNTDEEAEKWAPFFGWIACACAKNMQIPASITRVGAMWFATNRLRPASTFQTLNRHCAPWSQDKRVEIHNLPDALSSNLAGGLAASANLLSACAALWVDTNDEQDDSVLQVDARGMLDETSKQNTVVLAALYNEYFAMTKEIQMNLPADFRSKFEGYVATESLLAGSCSRECVKLALKTCQD